MLSYQIFLLTHLQLPIELQRYIIDFFKIQFVQCADCIPLLFSKYDKRTCYQCKCCDKWLCALHTERACIFQMYFRPLPEKSVAICDSCHFTNNLYKKDSYF
mgnify:CR=1 FL=1